MVVNLVASSADLYVCLNNLPIGIGSQDRFISLAFDVAHDGGPVPDSDDIRFILHEDGTKLYDRGNLSGGFVPDPTAINWDAVVGPNGSFNWNAEFRIPLSALGGGDRLEFIGFHIRHNWLRFQGDDYIWPTGGGWNVPRTWGDLIWLRQPENVIEVDVSRITQGLEYDVTARVPYDFIAAKKTYVTAQLYSTGANRSVLFATWRVSRTLPGGLAPQTFPVMGGPPRLNSLAYGTFNGSPGTYSFYFPGTAFPTPGTYRIELLLTRSGDATPQVVNLGTRTFVQGGVFNVLLLPVNLAGITDDGLVWSPAHTAAVPAAMREMERMMPVRDGIATFSFDPTAPVDAGIKYFFWPFAVSGTSDLAEIDVRSRTLANDLLHLLNRGLEVRDRGNVLGRIDRICILGASSGTGGGQAQFGWSPYTAGAGFDSNTRGASASVVVQEFIHCLNQEVVPTSPNSDGGSHSRNFVIPTLPGKPVWNMIDRTTYPNMLSVMYYLVSWVPLTFMEGYEWNYTRQFLVSKPRLPVKSLEKGGPLPEGKVFRFIGKISDKDVVTPIETEGLDGILIGLSQPAQGSEYKLLLMKDSTVLSELPFAFNFDHEIHVDPTRSPLTDKHDVVSKGHLFEPPTSVGLALTIELPDGTNRAEIRKGAQLLWSQDFSQQAPTISDVVAVDNQQGLIDLSWNCQDDDSPNLTHSIFLLSGENPEPILLVHGLNSKVFTFPKALAPAGNNTRFVVRCSDGLNMVEATSNAFTIENRLPTVQITAPNPTLAQATEAMPVVIQGQSTVLVAAAFDYTDGVLTGDSLEWESDQDGVLGKGELLPAVLPSAGIHQLTVTAKNSGALTATDSVSIEVLLDTDGDGLPDKWEDQHQCYDSQVFDSDVDFDGDLLSPFDEMRLGTNPCEADSDIDEVGDGDEFRLGSDPLDDGSLPPQNNLFVPVDDVDLGDCLQPTQAMIPVQTTTPQTVWSASTDAPWLIISGGGPGDGSITLSTDCKKMGPDDNTATLYVAGDSGPVHEITVRVKGIANPQGYLTY